jgi:hypothetical protein
MGAHPNYPLAHHFPGHTRILPGKKISSETYETQSLSSCLERRRSRQFVSRVGSEEGRTWNAWMRFANRAKQTWNTKELDPKIRSCDEIDQIINKRRRLMC